MSATETPLVTPDELNKILTAEIDGYRMREQVAKEANDKMRADLAARDALIGELRGLLLPVVNTDFIARHTQGEMLDWLETVRHAVARTPADAGAELARLRMSEISMRALGHPCSLREASEKPQGSLSMVHQYDAKACCEAIAERDALRAQLATAEADLVTAEGMIKVLNASLETTEASAESRLKRIDDRDNRILELDASRDRLRDEVADLGMKLAHERTRAEAAEARVREMEARAGELQGIIDNEGYPSGKDYDAVSDERDSLRLQLDSLRTSYGWQAARLRAVTEALQFYAGKRRADGNGYEFERELIRGEVARNALNPIHAARSGDLPSTERKGFAEWWDERRASGVSYVKEEHRAVAELAWNTALAHAKPGDLPPHPDAVRLSHLITTVRNFIGCHRAIPWGSDGDCGSSAMVDTLEASIDDLDAARAQAGKDTSAQ